ncbi:MAG: SDR family NAD(P)-dependent oxidoreductase [Coraliomargaritaceae bacterium]
MSPPNLSADVALITGGGTGLGLGIAKALCNAGAKVVLCGRREEPLLKAQAEIGQELCAITCGDITDSADRSSIIQDAKDAFGQPVSLLVNNAGNHLKKPASEVTDEEFQNVLSTHVNASFALSRDVYPGMVQAGRGNILFIASMASFMGVPNIVAYTAAKCAVIGLTRALAAEWSGSGIRVNAIAPGWIASPMMEKALSDDPVRKEKILSRTPMGGFGEAKDIGNAVTYLTSSAAGFVNGTILTVDGGASVGF